MCEYGREARPLYTTIESEYLQKLHQDKYLLECITKGIIKKEYLELIVRSLEKAKRKHPFFCDRMTRLNLEECRAQLEGTRSSNDFLEREGGSVADDILQEEGFEATEKYLEGDTEGFIEEMADKIAVEIRMMEMAENERRK